MKESFLAGLRYVELQGLPGREAAIEDLSIWYLPAANPGPPEHIQAHVRIPDYPKLRAIVLFEARAGKRVITQVTVATGYVRTGDDEPSVTEDGSLELEGTYVTSKALSKLKLDKVNREVSKIVGRYEDLGWISEELAQALGTATRSDKDDTFYAEVAASTYPGPEAARGNQLRNAG